MKSNSEIGLRVAKSRELRQKNQKELSDETGITREQINYLENGRRSINVKQLCAIADCLKVSTDYILGYKESPYLDEKTKEIFDRTGLDDRALQNLIEVEKRKPGIAAKVLSAKAASEFLVSFRQLIDLCEYVNGICDEVEKRPQSAEPEESLEEFADRLKYLRYEIMELSFAMVDEVTGMKAVMERAHKAVEGYTTPRVEDRELFKTEVVKDE